MKIGVNGINIEYRDEGKGLPVIFLHAFPLNQRMWDEQVAALSPICRAITVDLRGFGDSDVPPGPYWMALMASDVRGLMSKLSIDRAVLVGLSMGGYVAMAFYRNFAESVRALVLADTRAAADTPEAHERRLKSAKRVEAEGIDSIIDEMSQVLLGATTQKERPEVLAKVRRIAALNNPKGVAAAQLGMAARPDSSEMLASVKRRVLVIGGREDALSPPAVAEALQWRIQGSQLSIIERAGHLANLECPHEFNAALIGFIEYLNR
ncbi:MAG TPA: alpha/beta hydrolase [Blastocatellia bacterium]|nr:alpha/beta hydrolase [Blastocatellia bacterium]